MNAIVDQEKLPFDRADAEIGLNGERADIVLWIKRRVKSALLLEVKRPEEDLENFFVEARKKAYDSGITYFALWNINRLRLWKTPYLNKRCEFYESKERRITKHIVDLETGIDRYEHDIKRFLRNFLIEFSRIYKGQFM